MTKITIIKLLPMKCKLHSKADASLPLVIALHENEKADSGIVGKTKAALADLHMKKKTFSGKKGETLSTHATTSTGIQSVLLFGLGKDKELNDKEARNAGAQIIKAAQTWKQNSISIAIPESLHQHLSAFGEGMIMANYNPSIYKTGDEEKKRQKERITTVSLISKNFKKAQEHSLEKGLQIGEAVNYIRNLVNCDPRQLDTNQFVEEFKEVAKKNGYKITDFNKKKLTKMNMGGILAVNRGSEQEAHMMILEHNAKLKEDPIVICGKGIIFDTGGVSLKPSTHMHEMQLDMGGAAVVLGVFKLLKKLNIQRRVVGIVPITDNAIGNAAYRPSEIVTTYSGQTVEIMNTDAEGRMILCDALWYGAKEYQPRYLLDLATLTGACMIALGYRNAGLFGNDDELTKKIQKSSERTDEGVCHIPITDADEKAMKGKLADLTNLDSSSRYAGASRAAAFLKNFVDEAKWAHIDIAGPAFTKEPKPYESPMATGFGVRLIIDFLENLPEAKA